MNKMPKNAKQPLKDSLKKVEAYLKNRGYLPWIMENIEKNKPLYSLDFKEFQAPYSSKDWYAEIDIPLHFSELNHKFSELNMGCGFKYVLIVIYPDGKIEFRTPEYQNGEKLIYKNNWVRFKFEDYYMNYNDIIWKVFNDLDEGFNYVNGFFNKVFEKKDEYLSVFHQTRKLYNEKQERLSNLTKEYYQTLEDLKKKFKKDKVELEKVYDKTVKALLKP